MLEWIKNHFHTLYDLQINALISDKNANILTLEEGFRSYIATVKVIRENQGKLIFIGNGGSAGIASHLAIDYSKNGYLPALAFSDSAAITCLSNDYGYEHVFSKQMEFHSRDSDVLIAISSSGRSANILNAVAAAQELGCKVITFSGFDKMNPLRLEGDLNFFIDAKEYGYVEVAHVSLIHALLDYIISEDQYIENQRNKIVAMR